MKVLNGSNDVRGAVGEELGVSEWTTIIQSEVDEFAKLTSDYQWIHVDVERARNSPYGGTIVHGFFTLSLMPKLQEQVFRFDGFEFGLNYGLNRVRFPAPVLTGSSIRLHVTLYEVSDVAGGGLQLVLNNTVEVQGGDKPVCIAETVYRLYGDASS
jgi:acyl dehydratase